MLRKIKEKLCSFLVERERKIDEEIAKNGNDIETTSKMLWVLNLMLLFKCEKIDVKKVKKKINKFEILKYKEELKLVKDLETYFQVEWQKFLAILKIFFRK